MKAPANYIRKFRKDRGITLEQLAERTGLSSSHLNRMENGGRSVNTVNLTKISEALRVPAASLISGEALEPAVLSDRITVIGHLQAGHWGNAIEWEQEDRYQVLIQEDQRFIGVMKTGFEIKGESMNLKFPDKTVVVVVSYIELGKQPKSGDYVIVRRRNKIGDIEASCKEYVVDSSGTAWLWPRSTDPRFQAPLPCDPEDGDDSVEITGLVTQAIIKV